MLTESPDMDAADMDDLRRQYHELAELSARWRTKSRIRCRSFI